MIPLTSDLSVTPKSLESEHCCFCAARTNAWFKPNDVAVCAECAAIKNPDDVPTKADWCASPQARGISPDRIVADFDQEETRVLLWKGLDDKYYVDRGARHNIHNGMTADAAIGWMANLVHNYAHLASKAAAKIEA